MDVLEPGAVLADRFTIEAPLGRGVLGEVYRATQLAMGRHVAVKLLRAASLRSEHAHRRFEQEAHLLGRLAHPNIVQVFDFGIDEVTQRPFIALELIAGSTLLDLLRNRGPVPEAQAARICEQIALALAHAHAQGIVHRDLKPANVMLSDLADGRAPLVKVLDFGLGKLLGREEAKKRLTTPGQMLGTPSFASPEQALGDTVDERSDLYSLGCLAFALVAGRAPHAAADVAETLRQKRSSEAPALPATLQDGAPPSVELDDLYRHLMARRPSDRPAQARDVAARFAEIAQDAEQRTAAMRFPDDEATARPSVAKIVDGPTDVATRATQIVTPTDERPALASGGRALEAELPHTVPGVERPDAEHEPLPDTTPSADREALGDTTPSAEHEPLPDTTPGADREALADTTPSASREALAESTRNAYRGALSDSAPGVDREALATTRYVERGAPADTAPGVNRSALLDTGAARAGPSRATAAPLAEPAASPPTDASGPPPSSGAGSRLPLLLAGAAAVVAIAALIAANTSRSTTTPPPVTAPGTTPRVGAAPRIEVAQRPLHRVRIDSSPSGARVMDGNLDLGQTPLDLQLTAERLPQTLRLELAGHLGATIEIQEGGPATLRTTLRAIPRPAKTTPKHTPPKEPPEEGYPVW
ncbi:MAG: protein kinase [Deltaproteobacteria bacterium]